MCGSDAGPGDGGEDGEHAAAVFAGGAPGDGHVAFEAGAVARVEVLGHAASLHLQLSLQHIKEAAGFTEAFKDRGGDAGEKLEHLGDDLKFAGLCRRGRRVGIDKRGESVLLRLPGGIRGGDDGIERGDFDRLDGAAGGVEMGLTV